MIDWKTIESGNPKKSDWYLVTTVIDGTKYVKIVYWNATEKLWLGDPYIEGEPTVHDVIAWADVPAPFDNKAES